MSAMIVLRRGQQAMFSNFLEASHGITATVGEETSKCKEKRQKAVNENYQRAV